MAHAGRIVNGPSPITRQRSPWIDVGRSVIPDAQVWQRAVHDGHLTAMVAIEPLGPNGELEHHMSISHRTNHNPPRPGRYPTWDELAHARYELLPDHLTFVMFLPPPSEYVAVHDTTFHLHEAPERTNP